MNPVAFLRTKLLGIANVYSLSGACPNDGKHGDLVDDIRDPRTADIHSLNLGSFYCDVANRFARARRQLRHRNLCSHLLKQAEKARTGGV